MIPSPFDLKCKLPLSKAITSQILQFRETIKKRLRGEEKRLALLIGPCSLHHSEGALEYGRRLKKLSQKVETTCLIVMRAFIEKARTTTGWKGLLYDPHLSGKGDLCKGLYRSRELLLKLAQMGLPLALEFVDPLVAPYFDDLVSWGMIGARTCSSQPHRQLASSLPIPIGFKNSVDGNIDLAIHGIIAASHPHHFFQIDPSGKIASKDSPGNPWCHLVLRGSTEMPNYDPDSIHSALSKLQAANLLPSILVDCAHGNSQYQHMRQVDVFRTLLRQIEEGNENIAGMIVESYLKAGSQKGLAITDPELSATDPCIDWEMTESLVLQAHQLLHSSISV